MFYDKHLHTTHNNGEYISDDSHEEEPLTLAIDNTLVSSEEDPGSRTVSNEEVPELISEDGIDIELGNDIANGATTYMEKLKYPLEVKVNVEDKKGTSPATSTWQISDKISFDLKNATSSFMIINKRPRRAVLKNGEENVPFKSDPPKSTLKYLNDGINTMIDFKWRWLIFWFVLVHVITWFGFAVLWYIGSMAHGDFDEIDPPEHPCIDGSRTFLAVFLMSFETQTSIGFGERVVSEQCPEAIFLMMMQLVFASGLIGVVTSVMLVKMITPKKFCEGIGFSKNAVICKRDGKLCLIFRVWDLHQKHIMCTKFNVYLLRTVRTKEGEKIDDYCTRLNVIDTCVFLIWPVTIVHVIDETSPFYELSAKEMTMCKFEIVVCLTGGSPHNALTSQSQTSYLPKEIFWGFRFKNVLRYCSSVGSYVIDTEYLDTIEQVNTPLHSAKKFDDDEFQRLQDEIRRNQERMVRPLHTSASLPLMSAYSKPKWMPTLSPPLEGVASEGCSDSSFP